jgi:hypothetical protein
VAGGGRDGAVKLGGEEGWLQAIEQRDEAPQLIV